ncbi:hypothetical protein GmHk_06G016555 [Glycine max]|nr:hypothetical protein GmHk_06G016555 [Glycine max]
MSEEVDMDDQNEQECGVNEPHVFDSRNDVLQWARSVAHENRFVAVIIRSDTNIGSREKTSFVLIGCERSGEYKCRKKEFVRRDIGTRKCGCPFKLYDKPVVGGQGWMVKFMCGIHNHELVKSLVGHSYAGRLTKAEKTLIADMTKSMDEDVVRDIFWCHPDAVNTYKINKYRLPLLDFVGVTPTGMTFFAGFAYLEGERLNNVEFDECLKKVESAHRALKRVLQNSLGDLCSVRDVMNNMMTLQHMEIKASFETSTHVVGHVFKKTLYKRLLGMVLRYALNQIAAEFECVPYASKNPSTCGCVMRITHGHPCAYELSKYVVGCIPLDSIHMFWRRLSFSNQGLSEPEVSIKEEMETISKRFEELDVCGKFTLKSKLREIAYPDQNSMCPPPAKVNTKGAPKKLMNRNPRSTKRDPSY